MPLKIACLTHTCATTLWWVCVVVYIYILSWHRLCRLVGLDHVTTWGYAHLYTAPYPHFVSRKPILKEKRVRLAEAQVIRWLGLELIARISCDQGETRQVEHYDLTLYYLFYYLLVLSSGGRTSLINHSYIICWVSFSAAARATNQDPSGPIRKRLSAPSGGFD